MATAITIRAPEGAAARIGRGIRAAAEVPKCRLMRRTNWLEAPKAAASPFVRSRRDGSPLHRWSGQNCCRVGGQAQMSKERLALHALRTLDDGRAVVHTPCARQRLADGVRVCRSASA